MPKTTSITVASPGPAGPDSSDLPVTEEPLLLTLKAAAEKLSIGYWAMYRLVSEGVIPSCYQGRCRYVTPQALRDYVAGLPTTSPVERDSAS